MNYSVLFHAKRPSLRQTYGGRFGSLDLLEPSAAAQVLLPDLVAQGLVHSRFHWMFAVFDGEVPRVATQAKLVEYLREAIVAMCNHPPLRDACQGTDAFVLRDTARMLERREHGHAAYLARLLDAVRWGVPETTPAQCQAIGEAYYAERTRLRRESDGDPLDAEAINRERREARASDRWWRRNAYAPGVQDLVAKLPPGRHTFKELWDTYDGELGRNDFYAVLSEVAPVKKHAGSRYLVIDQPAAAPLPMKPRVEPRFMDTRAAA